MLKGSSPEDVYPGLEHERFHIQGGPSSLTQTEHREQNQKDEKHLFCFCSLPSQTTITCIFTWYQHPWVLGTTADTGNTGVTPQSPCPERMHIPVEARQTVSRHTNENMFVCVRKKQKENNRPGRFPAFYLLTSKMGLMSP